MKYFFNSRFLVKIGLLFIFMAAVQSVAGSTLFGTVYDNRQNALANVNVELLNEYRSLLKYTVTDGIGRYTFDGLGDGTYYVRVMPYRYDFDEEIQLTEIRTMSLTADKAGYTNQVLDFTLSPRKGTLAEAQTEVVYAQEIPNDAKKAFEEGQKLLRKKKPDEALVKFQNAVTLFPEYYLGNHYLGTMYFNKKDYEHAAPPLMKAAQINDRSSVTLYYLGYSLHQLNYNKAAVVALQAASVITPASPAIFTALGTSQRKIGEYTEAEKSLLRAKKFLKVPSSELYKELAGLYNDMKQYDKAAESLEQMLKSGKYSEADVAKIKEQIKSWKSLSSNPASKTN